jgi:hypothetical protein
MTKTTKPDPARPIDIPSGQASDKHRNKQRNTDQLDHTTATRNNRQLTSTTGANTIRTRSEMTLNQNQSNQTKL